MSRIFDDRFRVYAKLEGMNPSGSIKDRPALAMIRDGLNSGALRPGESVIVESSSGNLGIGLAQVCAYHGLRFICVVDAKTTVQNLAILRAYGAEIDLVTEVDGTTGEYLPVRLRRVRELVDTVANAYWPNQYANPLNPASQRDTMRELMDSLDGDVDYVFCATSSCGTLAGCADYLAEVGRRSRTSLIAVDAIGSVIFGCTPKPRLLPGHGAARRPDLFRPDLADEVIHVADLDCVRGCRRLVATEAILAGGSSGGLVAALMMMRPKIADGATCVLILPDRGERYLDTIYNDEWVCKNFGPDALRQQMSELEASC